jgi:hypothetical protein
VWLRYSFYEHANGLFLVYKAVILIFARLHVIHRNEISVGAIR